PRLKPPPAQRVRGPRGRASSWAARAAWAPKLPRVANGGNAVRLDAPSDTRANYAMTISTALSAAEAERLAAHGAELERERKDLLAVIELLKEVSTSLHFIDILQGIARKPGEAFGLDRCSIFLAVRGGQSVRLAAS